MVQIGSPGKELGFKFVVHIWHRVNHQRPWRVFISSSIIIDDKAKSQWPLLLVNNGRIVLLSNLNDGSFVRLKKESVNCHWGNWLLNPSMGFSSSIILQIWSPCFLSYLNIVEIWLSLNRYTWCCCWETFNQVHFSIALEIAIQSHLRPRPKNSFEFFLPLPFTI